MADTKISYLTDLDELESNNTCVEDSFDVMGSGPMPLPMADVKKSIDADVQHIYSIMPDAAIAVNSCCYQFPRLNCNVRIIASDGMNVYAKDSFRGERLIPFTFNTEGGLESFMDSYKAVGMPNPGKNMLELLYSNMGI